MLLFIIRENTNYNKTSKLVVAYVSYLSAGTPIIKNMLTNIHAYLNTIYNGKRQKLGKKSYKLVYNWLVYHNFQNH